MLSSGCRPLFCPISVFSYVATAAALDQETSGGVRKFEVCDNVDLEMMLLEFESYHYIKFHKFPKVIRRVSAGMNPLGSSKSCSLEAGVEVDTADACLVCRWGQDSSCSPEEASVLLSCQPSHATTCSEKLFFSRSDLPKSSCLTSQRCWIM